MCIYQVLYMYKIVTWLTTLSNTYQQAHWKFFKDKCHLRSNMHMYMHHTANHWACYPLGRCSVKAEIEVLSPSSEQQGHVIPFIATRWQVPIRSPCLWRWLIIPPAAAAAKSLQSCPTLCHAHLCRPWDSPGKNTGVGCHFLLQCMKVKSESEVAQLCPALRDPMDCSPPGSSAHGIFQARVLEWVAIAFSADYPCSPSNLSRVLYLTVLVWIV